jgi:hypothetical protein
MAWSSFTEQTKKTAIYSMSLFDCVLAFGDSHVVGMETIDDLICLPGSTNHDIKHSDELTKDLAFPNLVATHFGVPCYNYAMSGGSNARSLRLLTQVIHQHANCLVLFGYTSAGRTEFYMPEREEFLFRDEDFVQFIPGVLGPEWDSQQELYKMYFKYLYHPRNTLPEYIFCVDSICQTHATAYLHIPLFPEIDTACVSPVIKNMLNFENTNNYLDWCAKKNFVPRLYQHYGAEAHQALAQLIIQQLAPIPA